MTTSPPRSRRNPDPGQSRPPEVNSPAVVVAVKRIFGSENGDYFLLLGSTLFLVVFGLVMVLSSSSVESFKATDDFFTGFLRQALFALLGIPVMLIAARMPAVFWRKWSGMAMLIAVSLQFLVVATNLGVEHNGNRNWILLGSFSFQPSELVKVGLVIWLGGVLARRASVLEDWRVLFRSIGIVSGLAIALVLFGGDLGTAIILVAIVLGTLFFAGVRLRVLAIPAFVMAVAAIALSFSGGSRQERILAWQSGCTSDVDYNGLCWQPLHGWWALASGGIFGVGLGNSKAKWSWLPEADNDFIFAIIGEELGLIGAIVVLALFVVLAFSFIRIIRGSSDPAARITVSAVLTWIVVQAFVNIAVVLGLLPVLGVPLPLISAGGSALVTTLLAIGIVLSYARQPSAVRAQR
ncbi:MAG: putative lipid II flippase FtsW [Cryobacterium sp.]|nr:putative lipid II flippase FtsW [Cryobacterium sp.]MBX3310843.1 putative lipid II flippase FtsW [Cryobacterium sp.]MCB1280631.1 putative lipid II flippase FtsW [Salinibacterium sp.]